jgi:ATP-binding cassette subfamily F protein uup
MPLFTLAGAELAYGDVPLLDDAALAMDAGERIGLIGRNGTGKSSLLGILAGRVALDDGALQKNDGLKIAYVPQEPLPGSDPSVPRHRLERFFSLFKLDPDTNLETASGGERKRAALALAFAQEPDLLLLDEPTNHLDVDGILVLENLLIRQNSAIVITHDRAFLDRVATRIVELDRGKLFSFAGNFSYYESKKAEQLAAEAVAHRKFDRFWAQEEAWIRKGIEARRTRNEGRVTRLEHLREERAARRERLGQVKLSLGAGQRSGKLVSELVNVSKSFGGKPVIRDVSLIVSRGDKLGILGPNGAGKTTLLKLILGTLEPDAGSVRLGTKVEVAYFDQLRAQLDPEKTVAETISPGSDYVELESGRKHVMSYLADFLFPPRRAQSPVRMLSGGERNRLLLARLFARPANVLVLDEPTNDLDIESLELLEAALQDYAGTLLLVSHDRAFLDNVVTQTIAAEGDGKWKEYAGGYSDWLRQRPTKAAAAVAPSQAGTPSPPEKKKAKLSYKETRELEALPKEIETLEAEQRALAAKMQDPGYYKQPADALRADRKRVDEIEALLHDKLERWTALEAR